VIRHREQTHTLCAMAACSSGMGGLADSGAWPSSEAGGCPVQASAHGWQGSVWPRDGEAISGVDRGGHGGGGGGRFMRFCLSLSPNDRSRLVSGLGGLGEQGRQGDMSGRLGFAGVRGEGDGSTEPGRWGTWRDRDQLKPALALSPSR
jgi:hypothetical protein